MCGARRWRPPERDKFSKEKLRQVCSPAKKGPQGVVEGQSRRVGGGMALRGAGLLEATDVRANPPSSAPPPQDCLAGILLLSQALGKGPKFWKEESPPQLRDREWKMTTAGLREGSPRQGMELAPGLPGRVHQGPASALSWHRLARPWLGCLIPGDQSHMPGNPILSGPSPQLPAAPSKQGFWGRKRVSRAKQQGGSLQGEGSPGDGSPTHRQG